MSSLHRQTKLSTKSWLNSILYLLLQTNALILSRALRKYYASTGNFDYDLVEFMDKLLSSTLVLRVSSESAMRGTRSDPINA